jgi:hypothetical protein
MDPRRHFSPLNNPTVAASSISEEILFSTEVIACNCPLFFYFWFACAMGTDDFLNPSCLIHGILVVFVNVIVIILHCGMF